MLFLIFAVLFQEIHSQDYYGLDAIQPLGVCVPSNGYTCVAQPDLANYSLELSPTEYPDMLRRDFSFSSSGEVKTANLLVEAIDIFDDCVNYLIGDNITENATMDDITISETVTKQFQSVVGYLNFASKLYSSCLEIHNNNMSAPTGYYPIRMANGTVRRVYCDMEGTNCYGLGGWTRLGYFNMADSDYDECPYPLHDSPFSGLDIKPCLRADASSGGCDSIFYSNDNITYTHVCGRAIGYQYGSPDGLAGSWTIDQPYVDGISITYGSPRQHIWTYVCGVYQTCTGSNCCPCNAGSTFTTPSFVGSDYYCESAIPIGQSWSPPRLFTTDRLWDGQMCQGAESLCCPSGNTLPWFHAYLNGEVQDPIEMRLCANQHSFDEKLAIELFEIYIR